MCTKKTGRIIKKTNPLDVLSRLDDAPTEAMGADSRSKHGMPTRALHLCPLSGFLYSHHRAAISSLYSSKWKKLEWPRRDLSWSLQINSCKCLWCEDVLLLKQQEKGKWNEEVVWLLSGERQANKSRLMLIWLRKEASPLLALEDLRFQQQVGEVGRGKEWEGDGSFLRDCRSVEVGYGRLGNRKKNTYAKGKHQKRGEHKSGRTASSLLLQKHLRWESRAGNCCSAPQN